MLMLCIDTSYKYLSCALIEDKKLLSGFNSECFKRQSEEVFSAIDKCITEANRNREDIDAIAISIGPGSYTGVRIALTIAKVISSIKKLDLYTISTLRLYANNSENTLVLLNARSDRAYVGIYDKDKVIVKDCIMNISSIDASEYRVVGDGSLIGKEDYMPNISECFINNIDNLEKVGDIHHLVPVYLKENEDYLK